MNAKSAETLFRCHRGGKHDGDDARIRKAIQFAEKDAGLKNKLDEQIAFDARATSAIGTICTRSSLIERIKEIEKPAGHAFNLRAMLRTPPVLAMLIALLVLAGLGIYFGLSRMEDFPGKDDAMRMIEITEEMTGVEMEPKTAKAGDIEDWLFAKGFEGYFVPPEFAELKTLGGRVFKQDGLPVAQIAMEKNAMLFYVFKADDFGVKVDPPDQWRQFQDDEWTAAIRSHEGICFMVAFRGTKADMQVFLASAGK